MKLVIEFPLHNHVFLGYTVGKEGVNNAWARCQ